MTVKVKQTRHFYDFGVFRIDVSNRLLLCDGEPVALMPKTFDMLLLLVERHGEVLEKDELLEILWPDAIVEESNLTQNIHVLRRALEQHSPDGGYIKTIPRRGYRFVAEVREFWDEDAGFVIEKHTLARVVIEEEFEVADESEDAGSSLTTTINSNSNVPDAAATNAPAALDHTFHLAQNQPPQLILDVTPLQNSPNALALKGVIKHRRVVPVLLLAALIVTSAVVIFRFDKIFGRKEATSPFQKMKLTRLTTPRQARRAIISPDGRYIAYVLSADGGQGLWIEQTATQSNHQEVVPAADVRYFGTTFSPDGNFLYYIIKQMNNSIGVLYSVPALGGTPNKVLTDVDSPVTFSPDGKQIAFIRGSSAGEKALMIANVDGTGERTLAARHGDDFYNFDGPAWSPDGQKIACGAGGLAQRVGVVGIDVKDGTEKLIGSQIWKAVEQVAWLKDGSGLILVARDQAPNAALQLWYLSYTSGEARRITNDLSNYGGVSLTSASDALVTLQFEKLSSIWLNANESSNGEARQLTFNKYDGLGGLLWTPDHSAIIYTSNTNGKEGLWMVNADGTNQRLLSNRLNTYEEPSVSPDGRYVFFVSEVNGERNLWRLEIEGGDLKQLTQSGQESYAQVSPDGAWIVSSSAISGRTTLWKMNIDGSNRVQLTDKSAILPTISPDAKFIACYYRDELKSPWKIAVLSAEKGAPVKMLDIPPNVIFPTEIKWTPDGGSIAYIDKRNGVSNIWSKPVSGGTLQQLTGFSSDHIYGFDWSRDGKQLACARGALTSEVVLITDFK
ncbi:MAG: PD40 domain-containing protein [Acidobacteria bacterium]|nr:PD40 domain-containing protein [Acidobacteriota bacterium]